MFTEAALHAARETACSLSQQLDIDLIAPHDAEKLIAAALQAVNALQSVVDRFGVRAASGGAAKRAGFVNDAEWFGHKTQQNSSRAARRLKTARLLLRADDEISIRWTCGAWTAEQSDLIADGLVEALTPPPPPPGGNPPPTDGDAPTTDPDIAAAAAARRKREEAARRERQAALIKAAEEKRLDELRRQAAAAAAANKNRLNRGRKARTFWTRKEDDGLRGGFFLADGEGGLMQALLEAAQPEVLERHKALSKASGLPINWDHVRADTFVAVLGNAQGSVPDSGGSKRSSLVTYNVDVRVDKDGSISWPDTWLMNGDVPMPASVAESLAADPVLRYLFSVNGKLVGISKDTPDIPDWVRKAVDVRSGGLCERPNCGKPGKEKHHQQERYRGGLGTDPENIFNLCWFDHQLVTYNGFQLIGPPDDLHWLGPEDPVPDRLREWVEDFEAKCTRPARNFKTREFLPGEQRRREQMANAQRESRRSCARECRDDFDFDGGGSNGPTDGGRDPTEGVQESFF